MGPLEVFGLQLALSLVVYSLLATWYVAPWLAKRSTEEALVPLLFPHALRHVGLLFLVPGVVASPPPSFFAYTAAYGDLAAGLLAIASMIALRRRARLAFPLVWLFSVVGIVDLLNALRHADAVPALGATWYIPTFWVPILLVTHVMVLARLVRAARRGEREDERSFEATDPIAA